MENPVEHVNAATCMAKCHIRTFNLLKDLVEFNLLSVAYLPNSQTFTSGQTFLLCSILLKSVVNKVYSVTNSERQLMSLWKILLNILILPHDCMAKYHIRS